MIRRWMLSAIALLLGASLTACYPEEVPRAEEGGGAGINEPVPPYERGNEE